MTERERESARLVRVQDTRKHKSVGWQAVGSVDKRQSCPAAQKLSESDGWERVGKGGGRVSRPRAQRWSLSLRACLLLSRLWQAIALLARTHRQTGTYTHTHTQAHTYVHTHVWATPTCASFLHKQRTPALWAHTVRMRYMACYLSLAHCSRAMALTANKLPHSRAR